MEDERIFLSVSQAIECLNEGDTIHTYINPADSMLVGADWSRDAIIDTLIKHKDSIEIGGEMCRKMKHGLVVMRNGDPLFIEANEEKLKLFANR